MFIYGLNIFFILLFYIPYFLVAVVMLFFGVKYPAINALILIILSGIQSNIVNFYTGFDNPLDPSHLAEHYYEYKNIIEAVGGISFVLIFINYISAIIISIRWLLKKRTY
jgi:hypothetical protein